MRTVLMILLATVVSCRNTQSDNGLSKDSTVSRADNHTASTSAENTDFTKDSVIVIRFSKDSNPITVTGKIEGINKPVTLIIPGLKGNQLKVLLAPEDTIANVRINQIFMPDGKADGPFGRSLNRKLTQPGDYKIVIGEDLMQGEEWKGKFKLTIAVE